MIDEGAFHALYRDTAAPLRAYVARVLGSVGQADDIVQETYLRILQVPLLSNNPTQARAYLFRIASNLIADHFRRQKRESPLGEVPERAAPARDRSARIDMARVFRLLRLREGSVRVLLSRARRRLAALIEARER